MKIGILGTRGIPNRYGGFEQFAEYLSVGLVGLGAEVWVYNSDNHPYKDSNWKGVNLIRCYDPEDKIGLAGQFVYDFNCIGDSRKRGFDILLQLGYTTNSIWNRLLPRKPKIVTNMDGLEWKRSKYSLPIQQFLKYAERLAVKSSDLLIADSEVIREHIFNIYQKPSIFIPYGAEICAPQETGRLKEFGVETRKYFLLIARMQPDNHIEEIISGVLESGSDLPLLLIGSTANAYAKYLVKRYSSARIRFVGGIFEKETLDQLRFHSTLYFHGHSSGGTNPSLLEAMAASAVICAHDNPFNRSVLGGDAFYFLSESQVAVIIQHPPQQAAQDIFIKNNMEKIRAKYRWENIITAYYQAFESLL